MCVRACSDALTVSSVFAAGVYSLYIYIYIGLKVRVYEALTTCVLARTHALCRLCSQQVCTPYIYIYIYIGLKLLVYAA
jgi:hypothetical protein